jgi:hypothetical protein
MVPGEDGGEKGQKPQKRRGKIPGVLHDIFPRKGQALNPG